MSGLACGAGALARESVPLHRPRGDSRPRLPWAEVVEGAWPLTFPVLIQFPSLEQARRWYDSEDYRSLKALRLAASKANAIFLRGL